MKRFLSLIAVMVTLGCGAQVLPNRFQSITMPDVMATNSTSNVVSQPFFITPGLGLGLYTSFRAYSNTSTTSNMTFKVNLTVDGTNWLTTPPLVVDFPLNGTNVVKYYTNFAAGLFDSAGMARVETVTNGDTGNVVTNVTAYLTRGTR